MQSLTYKNTDRFSILDPNNPSNDIAGGSSNTGVIVARFRDAYETLRQSMLTVSKNPSKGNILEVIMKGDYSSFRKQRIYLRHIHETILGPCPD